MLYRGDYWQCAMIIPKGGFEKLKAEGLSGFRARLRSVAGFARDRVDSRNPTAPVLNRLDDRPVASARAMPIDCADHGSV